jgi:hypothetical protein
LVEDPLAEEIINGNVKEGDTVSITHTKDAEELTLKVVSK